MNIVITGVDGYLGTALAQKLLRQGHRVIGIDNGIRRAHVQRMKSRSATPVPDIMSKIGQLARIGEYRHNIGSVLDYGFLSDVVRRGRPDTIVHLAHMPSAAYSHRGIDEGREVVINNYVGTYNMLWVLREHCPDSHFVTIGTAGEYDHYCGVDIEEGYFEMEHKGRRSKKMLFPRRPGSIYHATKVSSTYLIDLLARVWNLRCTDIQQAIVFGAYTLDIECTRLHSRLDSDEAFGTVLNRFVVQAALKMPLTVYGEGEHQRGFLSLADSMQALQIAIDNPANPGDVQTWNQMSEWHSMNEIAHAVARVCPDTTIQHIDTPRAEHTGDHYYRFVTDTLVRMGYIPTRTIEQEIEYTFNLIKDEDLEDLRQVVIPSIKWR